jgi:hypothetical protein
MGDERRFETPDLAAEPQMLPAISLLRRQWRERRRIGVQPTTQEGDPGHKRRLDVTAAVAQRRRASPTTPFAVEEVQHVAITSTFWATKDLGGHRAMRMDRDHLIAEL